MGVLVTVPPLDPSACRGRPAPKLAASALVVGTAVACWVNVSAGAADSAETLSASASTPQLLLRFDERPQPPEAGFTSPVNTGTARLAVSVRSIDGGEIMRRRARSGSGGVARMPRHNAAPDAPRAVIAAVDRVGDDALNPARSAFTFGADFKLDASSEQTGAGSTDNGNNLVQRGLFNSTSQYKLQVDHRQALCRVKGSDGAVTVTSRVSIDPGAWYRARCTRAGQKVTLAVASWDASGRLQTIVDTARGRTGNLRPESRSVPLSIGGKLSTARTLLPSTDQFNGRIDNVILRLK